jgi:hypothetical protein
MDDGVSLHKRFGFDWSAKGIGFGQFYFYQDKYGVIHCDNECMSKEFIKRILCSMVDQCELADKR